LGAEYEKAGKSAEDAGEKFAFRNEELIAESNRYSEVAQKGAEKAGQLGKEVAKSFNTIRDEVKQSVRDAESEIGTANANILGNISKSRVAFMDLGRVVTGEGFSLRSLSSNFSLLGPAVTLAAVAIGALGYELYKSYQYYKDLNDITKQYAKVVDESAAAQAQSVVSVQKMNDLFGEAKAGLISHTDALNEYNKQFGDSIGKAKTFNEAEQKFVDRSPAYVQAMEQRAIANAAYKLEQDALAEQIKNDADGLANFWQRTDVFFTKIFQGEKKGEAIRSAIINKNHEDNQTLIDQYSKIAKAAEDAAAQIDKVSGIDTLGKGKDSKKQHDESLAEQKKYVEESQKIEEDAEQKAITTENEKYEKIKADLEKANHSTEELTRQHLANIESIHNEFAEKQFEKAQAAHAKRQQEIKDQDLKAEQHLKTIEDQISAHYNKDENIEVSARQKALNEADAFYQKEKAALAGHDKELEQLTTLHKAEIAKINKEYDDKALSTELEKDAQELKRIDQQYARDDKNRIAELERKKRELDADQDLVDSFYEAGILTDQQYTKQVIALSKARSEINAQERSAYAGYADQIAGSFTKIGSALGKQTALGKDFAVAGATIAAISSAVKAYDAMAGIPVVGPALGIAAAAAALVAGFENVKKIEATKIPGQGGGSSSASSSLSSTTSAINGGGGSLTPQLPAGGHPIEIAPQSINQMQSRTTTAEPVQAFVVESQVTGTQQRTSSYRNAATI